jgi:acetyl-CoA carboxylase carboxyl transferase subunit alpha
MYNYLDFEKPVQDLELKILELKKLAENGEAVDVADEITRLEKRSRDALRDLYRALTPWQKVQVARHSDRPHCVDYIKGLFSDFTPLAGDRNFGEDQAIVGGFARFRGEPVAIIGQEKGSDTTSRLKHNFGSVRPEGYRKAVRLMELADRFKIPLLTLVDTAGAYPGLGAEERGQAEAIAVNLREMAKVESPILTVVIGEGGSGGALAIAVADVVLMFENSIYSVISPEGCASILWRDGKQAPKAAEALKLTATHLLALGVVDGVLPEPVGGAHREPEAAAATLKAEVLRHLAAQSGVEPQDRVRLRREKFRRLGVVVESAS